MSILASQTEYTEFVVSVKQRILHSQYKALKSVNKELIALYWDIGKSIVEKQDEFGWGKSVVKTLADDLQKEFVGIKGFELATIIGTKTFRESRREKMPRGGRVKQYPEDLKQTAIEMALQGDRSTKAVAEELGISPKTLYGWLRRYRQEHGLNGTESLKEESMEAELKRLRRENTRLKMEREILKKATAYFAKETL